MRSLCTGACRVVCRYRCTSTDIEPPSGVYGDTCAGAATYSNVVLSNVGFCLMKMLLKYNTREKLAAEAAAVCHVSCALNSTRTYVRVPHVLVHSVSQTSKREPLRRRKAEDRCTASIPPCAKKCKMAADPASTVVCALLLSSCWQMCLQDS